MGAGKEPVIPECVVLNNKKTAHDPEGKPQQFWHVRQKKAFLLIPALLVIVFLLTVALIIVGIFCSKYYNLNNKKKEDIASFLLSGSKYYNLNNKENEDIARFLLSGCQFDNLNNEEREDDTSSILPAAADTNKALLPDPCQDDWVWYRQKCYYFSGEDKTWADSLEFCKSQGASLVIIESEKELKFLFRSKYDHVNYWIGLKSTDDNKGWTWVNGTLYTGDIFTVPKFSSKTQYAYLNKKEVKAQNEIFENCWICSKSAFSEN